MSLNKQKGNMYGFVTHTWNIIKGICPHDCSYCYMKRWGKLNPVRFDKKELKTNLGKNNFIFVGSSCDMFANEIPDSWIYQTIVHCNKHPENKYLFQTKNPARFKTLNFPDNSILCVTIESNVLHNEYMGYTPHPAERAYIAEELVKEGHEVMITIEPIMSFDTLFFIQMLKDIGAFQINVGADSGNNKLPEPTADQTLNFMKSLSDYTKVYQKDNLARLLK